MATYFTSLNHSLTVQTNNIFMLIQYAEDIADVFLFPYFLGQPQICFYINFFPFHFAMIVCSMFLIDVCYKRESQIVFKHAREVNNVNAPRANFYLSVTSCLNCLVLDIKIA